MTNHLQIAESITELLENRFNFLGLRFGFDPLIGLIPGLGDFISLVFSFYLIWIGTKLNLPHKKISSMLNNIFLDFIIGIVPVFGDFGDFIFKANSKNLAILKEHQRYKNLQID